MEHRWEGVVDSDCGENSEKEVKNEGKEKKSVIIRETFLPDYFCHSFSPTFSPPSPTDGLKGMEMSLLQVNVREIYLVSFSPSQLRENLPTPNPFTPSHTHTHAISSPSFIYLLKTSTLPRKGDVIIFFARRDKSAINFFWIRSLEW